MNWGDIPTWIAAVVAAVAAGASWWAARKSKAAEAKAEQYQRDALTAAQDAAAAEGRAAAALEEQNRLAAEQADAAEGVPWSVEYSHGSKWLVVNNSDRPKFRVQIGGPGIVAKRTPGLIDRIDGRSSYEVWGNTAWDGQEHRVEITWYRREDGSDEPRRWSAPMPPRPPRG